MYRSGLVHFSRILAGVAFCFYLAGCAPIPPRSAEVEPVPAKPETSCRDLDDDRDGTSNCDDRCPATAAGTSVSPDGCSMAAPLDDAAPSFPTRPPRPATHDEVDITLAGLAPGTSLGRADDTLCAALKRAGYSGIGHYTYPGGFALMTRLERIHTNGSPYPGVARWLPYAQPMTLGTFDLARYFRMLVNADRGYYRVIAFIVSSDPVRFDGQVPPSQIAVTINHGATALPASLRAGAFDQAHRLTVLVYEMTQAAVGRAATSTSLGLTVDDHLLRTHIVEMARVRHELVSASDDTEESEYEYHGSDGAGAFAHLAGVADFERPDHRFPRGAVADGYVRGH